MNLKMLICLMPTVLVGAGCQTTVPAHQAGVSNNLSPTVDAAEPKSDAPLSANTHFAAGQVAESQGDLPRALLQYEAACKLDHTASVPLLRMGMIYTRQAKFDEAVDVWKRYIQVTNGDASGYTDLGYTLELAQRFPQAESAYQSAIAKNPKDETARVDYGLMLARQGRMADATDQLKVSLSPAEVHYNLASVLESQGKKEDARSEYRAALKLDPNLIDAQTRLAAIDIN